MHREPDVGFDPGSPGSRPGPKAGAKPLRHPGIPDLKFLYFEGPCKEKLCELFANFIKTDRWTGDRIAKAPPALGGA